MLTWLTSAMQRYGMILADAGQIALTAQSDRFTNAKWDDLLGPHDLVGIEVNDFEVVEGGERFEWNGDCVRSPDPPRHLRIVKP